MYDSGGISLKPSDPMHLLMKMDMGGAASVLARSPRCAPSARPRPVTGWLMCTDNMPSGSAYKLGDVLTARGGTTVEVKNTDAEGRLAMMDALVLANEDGVDAIVDIATLTGAALMALGPSIAGADRQRRQPIVAVVSDAPTRPTSRLAAPAREEVPQAARLRRRRHLEPRRRVCGRDDRGALPRRVRGRDPVGAPRHRGHDAVRRRRLVALEGRDRVRRARCSSTWLGAGGPTTPGAPSLPGGAAPYRWLLGSRRRGRRSAAATRRPAARCRFSVRRARRPDPAASVRRGRALRLAQDRARSHAARSCR